VRVPELPCASGSTLTRRAARADLSRFAGEVLLPTNCCAER
jgi:hypothetical protein